MRHALRCARRLILFGLVLLVSGGLLTSRAPDAAAAPALQAIDCDTAVFLHFYPAQPSAGDTISLIAGVYSTLSNSGTYSGRWLYNGSELDSTLIEGWNGCQMIFTFEYTCNGATYTKLLIIPDNGCVSDSNWLPVVGGIAAVAAVAAAAARKRRGKKQGDQYILQLSAKSLETVAGRAVPLEVHVWQVTPQGGFVAAPGASLVLSASSLPSGLQVTPASGGQSLLCSVSAPVGYPGGRGDISVAAKAGGKSFTDLVSVSVQPLYRIEITSHDAQNAVPVAPDDLWAYARVTAVEARPQAELDRLTQQLSFRVVGQGANLVKQRDEQFARGWQAVRLYRDPPTSQQPAAPSLEASVVIDGHRFEAQLPLSIETKVMLGAWALGQKSVEVSYDEQRKRWQIPDIIVYFHDSTDDQRPVEPAFKYGFPTPPMLATPPALVVHEFFGHAPHQYTLRLKPAPGANLSALLKQHARQTGGPVQVTVVAQDDTGAEHRATVTLLFKPAVSLQFKPSALTLHAGREERLQVTYCAAAGDGAPQPVPDGQIELHAEPDVAGLTLEPVQGASPLSVRLLLRDLQDAQDFDLVVTGRAPGLPSAEARYPVTVALDYALEFRYPQDLERKGAGLYVRPEYALHPENPVTAHCVALDASRDPAEVDQPLTEKIELALGGANHKRVHKGDSRASWGAPAQTCDLTFVWPADGESFEDDDPELEASLQVGQQPVNGKASLDLDACRLAVLHKDLEAMAVRLAQQGYYVRNAFLGNLPADAAYQAYGITWDWTAGGLWVRNRGMRCGDLVDLTRDDVLGAIRRVYGDRGRLERVEFDEKSTFSPQNAWDQLDRVYRVSHVCFLMTTPRGKRFSIDFWERLRYGAGNPPVLQDYESTRQTWLQRLAGDVDPATFAVITQCYQPGRVVTPASVAAASRSTP